MVGRESRDHHGRRFRHRAATATIFVREGAKVVVADISAEGGEETVRMMRARGGEALLIKADVTKPADVGAMIERTVEAYGRLDAAFNNAGFEGQQVTSTFRRLAGVTPKAFRERS